MNQTNEAAQDERQSMMEALSMCIDALHHDADRAQRETAAAKAIHVLGRAALKAQPAPTEAANYGAAMPHRAVLGICDAYESGIGHGMQRDQHSSGSIYGNPDHATAYEIGYQEGKDRSTFKPEGSADVGQSDKPTSKQAMAGYYVACKFGVLCEQAFKLTDEMFAAFDLRLAQVETEAQGEDSARLDELVADALAKVSELGTVGAMKWLAKSVSQQPQEQS